MADNKKYGVRINFHIKVPEVRVVLEDGTQEGVMPTHEAIRKARELGIDLVEINPKTSPPICKLIEFGKYKYDEKKKQSAANKTHISELKEVQLSYNIEENDLSHKINLAKKFLEEKHKVRISLRFRGREITHTDIGKSKIDFVLKELLPVSGGSSAIAMDAKIMSVTVIPKK